MSHFSKIKTKLTDRGTLLKALLVLGEKVDVNQELVNPIGHDHDKVLCEVTIGTDIGFRRNKSGTYELVTDIQTWSRSIPPKRFIDKVAQEYAIATVLDTKDFDVESRKNKLDGSVEIVMARWK